MDVEYGAGVYGYRVVRLGGFEVIEVVRFCQGVGGEVLCAEFICVGDHVLWIFRNDDRVGCIF